MSVSQTNFPLEEASKIVQAAISAGLINLPFLAQRRAESFNKLIDAQLPDPGDISRSSRLERTFEAEREILARDLTAAARRDALYLRHFFAALQGIELRE